MISVLYEQWDNWALPSAQDPKGTLLRISKLAGLTQEKFNACLTNQKLVDDIFAERNKAEKDYRHRGHADIPDQWKALRRIHDGR